MTTEELKERVQQEVQPMITELEVLFEDLGKKKFIPYFIEIMNGSTQNILKIEKTEIVLIMRCKVINEEDTFWKAVFSDGTRDDFYESDGIYKLITIHKQSVKDVESRKEEVKHWLFFEKSAIVSEAIGKQEGTFIQVDANSIENGNRLLLKMFRACNYENYKKSDEELKEILMGAISPKKPDTGKKEIYFDHNPNPTKQRQIDTSVIGDCTEKQDKPVEVSTNTTTIGPGDNKNLEKNSTYRRRKKRFQPKNRKKNSEPEEATNKLNKSSSCSTFKQISRQSSTLSLNSQPVSMSRNSSQLSLNSIGSDAKKKQKKRKQKPINIKVQKDISDGIDISKIDQNKPSDQESTDSEALPVIEEDPRDKRVKERLRRKNVETHGMFRKEFMETEYS